MKLLFLCSQNKRRSLTAEKVLNGVDGHEVKSAGTESNARIRVNRGVLGWADVIFVMEKKHNRRIRDKFNSELYNKQIICLNIADEYAFMDKELVDAIEAAYDEWKLNRQ